MSFRYTERHREEYLWQGYTVLRGVIPARLLTDLRRETDKARAIARRLHGPQAQRLQPVYAYEELNAQVFRDFLELEGLRATVEGILGKEHHASEIMGVLLEPAERAWCTHWHRDWGYNVPHVNLDVFFEAVKNLRMFNQLNAALYEDHSLWVVPGSHNRRDTPGERAVFPVVPPPGPELPEDMTAEERELACLTYARRMPGAVNVGLFAGDVAFYRSCQWHLGSYVPYVRRATLHDGFYCAEDDAWREQVRRWQAEARSRE
ncbi:MAG: hypothetical protein RMJ43_08085 [Chloroherpetonaceae bacterium]|nr:hypothetical protein [Chthonomonadaceae bacterium]MDW8207781.1 hypothetical protein [Chloroherpetonaceae bacterium]